MRVLIAVGMCFALLIPSLHAGPIRPADPVVFVAVDLPEDEWLMLVAAIAASGHRGPLLRQTPATADGIRRFIDAYRPARTVTVRAGEDPRTIWKLLSLDTDRVLVASGKSRPLAIQAAVLAGLEGVPLWLADESSPESRKRGEAIIAATAETTLLRDADHVAQRIIDIHSRNNTIQTVIVTHPNDALHALNAPWASHLYRAPVVFTHGDVNTLFRPLPKPFAKVDSIILLGSPAWIPTERRPNPLEGKDAFIEMEPLTPEGNESFTFSVGRLFDSDPGGIPLTLARQCLPRPIAPRALIASNPGGSLDLLEMCSRHSARELRLRGLDTTELFREELTAASLKREMPGHDLIIWEGHHNTLMRDWQFPTWDEPLRPGLVMLQSCLSLTDEKVRPLFRRGAVAVVSTSSRTYSASGGAFTLAYLDAMLHDELSAGAALRQAKNFLLLYGKLKEQRLSMGAKLVGANRRSAWAFTLWGDPTWKPSLPDRKTDRVPAVRWEAQYDQADAYSITVRIPRDEIETVRVGGYRAQIVPNMRIAGLLTGEDDDRRPVPLVFGEIALPHIPDGVTPKFQSKLAARGWTHMWDARRKVVYLIAVPRADDQLLRFRVTWTHD